MSGITSMKYFISDKVSVLDKEKLVTVAKFIDSTQPELLKFHHGGANFDLDQVSSENVEKLYKLVQELIQ